MPFKLDSPVPLRAIEGTVEVLGRKHNPLGRKPQPVLTARHIEATPISVNDGSKLGWPARRAALVHGCPELARAAAISATARLYGPTTAFFAVSLMTSTVMSRSETPMTVPALTACFLK